MSSEPEKSMELEQVPLKSDTDAPAGTTEESSAVSSAPAKKGWFLKKSKKPVVETSAEDKPEDIAVDKPKKKCWWSKTEKSETEQKADHISIGINLVDRDEKGINDHVKLGFEDIFGEAETQHSWDCVWRLVFRVFTWTRLFIYRFFSLIIGLPAAIIFGILFAFASVINVFACVPCARLLSIPGNWLAKTWKWFVHATLDPIASSLGLFFSSFTIRKYGINSQPTDPCVA